MQVVSFSIEHGAIRCRVQGAGAKYEGRGAKDEVQGTRYRELEIRN